MNPISLRPLWDVCFVANDEGDAMTQARKQIEPYIGKVVLVDRMNQWGPTGWEQTGESELDLWFGTSPVPVKVICLESDECMWDEGDGSMIPMWRVEAIADGQVVVESDVRHEPRTITLNTCDDLTTDAPAVGTAEGFNVHERELIAPDQPWWPDVAAP